MQLKSFVLLGVSPLLTVAEPILITYEPPTEGTEVIGVRDGDITVYKLRANMFNSDAPATNVRIAAALTIGLDSTSGPVGLTLKDYEGQTVGYNRSTYIDDEDYEDTSVDTDRIEAPTLYVSATENAICIPYITVTWADGTNYGWVGDWGRACNASWYYSGIDVASGYKQPSCTWIAVDRANGIQSQTMVVDLSSFTRGVHSVSPDAYCDRAFHMIRSTSSSSDELRRRRFNEPDNRLVISHLGYHDAAELCRSETSVGPDFVSFMDKTFCNMETRELLPLCSRSIRSDCFDTPSKKVITKYGVISDRNYTEVIHWD